MTVAKVINRTSDLVYKICCVIVVALLGAMVAVTSLQIICRVFFNALSWSEEVARYLLIWATFIGAGCVYKTGGHVSVSFLQDMLPEKTHIILQTVVHLLCSIFFIIATYYGIKYIGRQGGQLSAALRIPMRYMYAAIPINSFIMLLHAVNMIIQGFMPKEVTAQ